MRAVASERKVFLERIFPGDSELAGRMRRHDWAASPLGSPEAWPENLRTALAICLTSRFPMHVWWGERLTLFYNDAYISFLGKVKHPAVLGRSGREAWSEIWDTIGPMVDGVFRTGKASWSEDTLMFFDRAIPKEEVYATFSFSPILGQHGRVDGLFCACTETTGKLIGSRRIETLRKLGTRSSEAQSIGAACESWAEVLAQNPHDIPFAEIFLVDPVSKQATLAATAGLSGPDPLSSVAPTLASALRHRRAEEIDLAGLDLVLSGGLVLPGRPWPEPARRALVLPIPGASHDEVAGLLLVGLSPRLVLDGAYRSFFGLVASHIGTAITESQAYGAERKRAESLAQLDRAKTAFISNVSEEFRTPLTLILGPVEDALASPEPALRGETLETVQRTALRLLKLVNAMLDFSRIEAGRAQASYEPVDLAALTGELAGLFRSAIERAGLRFNVRCDPLPEPVYVDRDLWEKIVLNLLSNACKFTFRGEIEIVLAAAGERALLTVRDTGTGVAADQLPCIFDRFHRIEGAGARTHEGSGIGLALVQELVRMHGGEITAESQLGKGTKFSVSLPFGSAHLPSERIGAARTLPSTATGAAAFVDEALRWLTGDSPAVASVPPARSSDELAGARILVADDNADLRDYVARLLGERWVVETVADGEAALQTARRSPFDLVLSDVMMPGLDGVGLLKELRADPALRTLPVILVSARAGEDSRVEGMQTGADDYLIKPFSARELMARVEAHLKLSRQRGLATQNAALVRLHELASDLMGKRELPDLLQAVLQAAIEVAGTEMGTLQVYDDASQSLKLVAHRALSADFIEHFRVVREDSHSVYGETIHRRERLMVEDVRRSPLLEGTPELALLEAAGVRAVQSTPITARDGSLLGVVSTQWRHVHRADESTCRLLDLLARQAADLIEHQRTQEELRRKEEELRAANRRKDEFISILSHELRNPLAPIMTALEVLRLRTPGERTEELRIIERQARHMVRLVDDLLDVTRITQGRIQLERRAIRMKDVLARAVEMASPLMEEREQQLDVRIPPATLRVHGDEARLAQVLANLLTNAAKYTEPGGRISIRTQREGGDVLLEVEDTGIGISAELLPSVFDLFTQARQDADRARGGLGIGLAIVRSLVELHGGTVVAASKGAGMGSRFTVRLPAAREEAALEAAHDAAPPTTRTARRILLVDDNEDALRLLAILLSAAGHEVVTAPDGPTALDLLASFKAEIAVLDIGLPVIDGYELAERLRAKYGDAAPALIALTGYGQDVNRARSKQAGFSQHLTKPIKARRLLEAIERQRLRGKQAK